MKRMLFIFNPFAGRRRVQEKLPELLDIFSGAGWDTQVYPTKAPLDGRDYVLRRGKEYDLIVCSGGDGTMNEISGAVEDARLSVPMGYLPAGSTNDFGRGVGLGVNLVECAKQVIKGRERALDTGEINGKHFIYVVAFGPLTRIAYTTPQKLKNLLGRGAYVLWGIREIFSLRSTGLRASWRENGKALSITGKFLFGMVSNALSIGGFQGITGNDVKLDDGLFEVTLIRTPRGFGDWKDIVSFARGEEIRSEQILRFKSGEIHFKFETPVSFTLDGERGGNFKEVHIRNKARALRLLT